MNFSNSLLLGFFLLIGVPCLFIPRQMQDFVIRFNARMGSPESPDSFRRTEKYLVRLRLIGLLMVAAAVFVLLMNIFAEDIARAVI